MKVDLKKVNEGTTHLSLLTDPERIRFLEDVPICEKIALELDINRHGDAFNIGGSVKAGLKLECSRCLGSFQSEISADFRVVAKMNGAQAPAPEDLEEGELFQVTEADQMLDLSERVKDEILLAIPVKPLCKTECRGLCSVCGRDLNQGTCECKASRPDPRWEGLMKLKNRGN